MSTDRVKQWNSKMALESPKTARLYFYQLNIYWKRNLHNTYLTIDDYVDQVRKEQDSNDINLRRKWASDLGAFVNAYVSKLTDQALADGYEDFQSNGSNLHVLRKEEGLGALSA